MSKVRFSARLWLKIFEKCDIEERDVYGYAQRYITKLYQVSKSTKIRERIIILDFKHSKRSVKEKKRH